jgi:dephospho-CoA kinase
VVFSDETMRTKLNGIIHPAVGEAFERFCNRFNKAPYVLKEAAITIETGLHEQMDAVILVTAPEETRIERVMARDGVSAEDVRRRISVQWSDEEKRPHAHFEVVNDDRAPLIPAVLKIHRALLERSET